MQWFLPDAAAFDHIFDRNSTYRDANLAFNMRGMLGVRSCTPLAGESTCLAVRLPACTCVSVCLMSCVPGFLPGFVASKSYAFDPGLCA